MPYAPINGIDLYYESHGDGPALVFAHGRGGNHLSWWQQVPFFRGRYRCITFDHRNFGRSKEETSRAGRGAFAADLRELLDHLGIEQACLVAQSMGGWTCLAFALAHPERTRALVLADTTAGITNETLFAALRPDRVPSDLLARVLGQDFCREHADLAFLYQSIEALNMPDAGGPSILSGGNATAADLVRLSAPILLILGSEDPIVPRAAGRVLQSLMPGARLAIVPGAGHSVYFERPHVFNWLVWDFLDGIAKDQGC